MVRHQDIQARNNTRRKLEGHGILFPAPGKTVPPTALPLETISESKPEQEVINELIKLTFSLEFTWTNVHVPHLSVYLESESEVAQSCPTLCDPMDCSLPGSSVHGIFQARVLKWGAISFSRGSSRPREFLWNSHQTLFSQIILSVPYSVLPSSLCESTAASGSFPSEYFFPTFKISQCLEMV